MVVTGRCNGISRTSERVFDLAETRGSQLEKTWAMSERELCCLGWFISLEVGLSCYTRHVAQVVGLVAAVSFALRARSLGVCSRRRPSLPGNNKLNNANDENPIVFSSTTFAMPFRYPTDVSSLTSHGTFSRDRQPTPPCQTYRWNLRESNATTPEQKLTRNDNRFP